MWEWVCVILCQQYEDVWWWDVCMHTVCQRTSHWLWCLHGGTSGLSVLLSCQCLCTFSSLKFHSLRSVTAVIVVLAVSNTVLSVLKTWDPVYNTQWSFDQIWIHVAIKLHVGAHSLGILWVVKFAFLHKTRSVVMVNRSDTETTIFCYFRASLSLCCFWPKMARFICVLVFFLTYIKFIIF